MAEGRLNIETGQAQANIDQLTRKIERFGRSLRPIGEAVERLDKRFTESAKAAEAFARSIDALRQRQNNMNRQLQALQSSHTRLRRQVVELTKATDRRRKVTQNANKADEAQLRFVRLLGRVSALAIGPLSGVGARIQALQASIGVFGAVMTGVIAATAAAASAFGALITVGARAERSMARISGILRATGFAAGKTALDIEELGRSIGLATLSSRREVEQAAGILLTFRQVGGTVFNDALKLSVDLAEVGFGSVRTAAIQLGKALQDPVQGLSGLKRVGVDFTRAQREQIEALFETGDLMEAQKIIVEELENQVGGAGLAAATNTLAGAWDTFAESIGIAIERMNQVTGVTRDLAGAFRALANLFNRVFDPEFGLEGQERIDARRLRLQDELDIARAEAARLEKQLQETGGRRFDAGIQQGIEAFIAFATGQTPLENQIDRLKDKIKELEQALKDVDAAEKERQKTLIATEEAFERQVKKVDKQRAAEKELAQLMKLVNNLFERRAEAGKDLDVEGVAEIVRERIKQIFKELFDEGEKARREEEKRQQTFAKGLMQLQHEVDALKQLIIARRESAQAVRDLTKEQFILNRERALGIELKGKEREQFRRETEQLFELQQADAIDRLTESLQEQIIVSHARAQAMALGEDAVRALNEVLFVNEQLESQAVERGSERAMQLEEQARSAFRAQEALKELNDTQKEIERTEKRIQQLDQQAATVDRQAASKRDQVQRDLTRNIADSIIDNMEKLIEDPLEAIREIGAKIADDLREAFERQQDIEVRRQERQAQIAEQRALAEEQLQALQEVELQHRTALNDILQQHVQDFSVQLQDLITAINNIPVPAGGGTPPTTLQTPGQPPTPAPAPAPVATPPARPFGRGTSPVPVTLRGPQGGTQFVSGAPQTNPLIDQIGRAITGGVGLQRGGLGGFAAAAGASQFGNFLLGALGLTPTTVQGQLITQGLGTAGFVLGNAAAPLVFSGVSQLSAVLGASAQAGTAIAGGAAAATGPIGLIAGLVIGALISKALEPKAPKFALRTISREESARLIAENERLVEEGAGRRRTRNVAGFEFGEFRTGPFGVVGVSSRFTTDFSRPLARHFARVLQQIDQGFAEFLTSDEIDRVATRIQAESPTRVINRNLFEQKFANIILDRAALLAEEISDIEGFGELFRREFLDVIAKVETEGVGGLARITEFDPQDVIEFTQDFLERRRAALDFIEALRDETPQITEGEKAIAELRDTLQVIFEEAESLGILLSDAEVKDLFQRGLDKIRDEANAVVEEVISNLVDPLNFALDALLENQQNRLDEIVAAGGDIEAALRANDLELLEFFRRATDPIQDAIGFLERGGSAITPRGEFRQLEQAYADALRQANLAPTVGAREDLAQAALDFEQGANDIFGSGSRFATIQEGIRSDLQQFIGRFGPLVPEFPTDRPAPGERPELPEAPGLPPIEEEPPTQPDPLANIENLLDRFREQISSTFTAAADLDFAELADRITAVTKEGEQGVVGAIEFLTESILDIFGSAVSGVPGMQHGGLFRVGGSGGLDSQLVAFRATPGESVDVRPAGQGNRREETVEMIREEARQTEMMAEILGELQRQNRRTVELERRIDRLLAKVAA